MAKATFIIGLCGSGKTHLCDQLVRTTGAKVFESLVENWRTDLPRLLQCLAHGQDCIVEEISFCIEVHRDKILRTISDAVPAIEVEWICFENDLDAANWNVTNRENK